MADAVPFRFKKLQNFKSNFADAEFTQYESTRTGLRVVVVDRRSTKVQGEFCLATEIHDDSGAPHTLEHLVFMGSRSYQYKGVLDKLANRAYSSTNAWTDTDHTNYTLETAGWQGFSQILPIYLEHIILPTITDSACYTEVHHIDGEGSDAGVVYSEMQALQNTATELIDVEVKKLLFPVGIGFRYETGGMMAPLRNLTNERIRSFHKLMYQPKNLRLCIAGQVNHTELLEILDKFEDTIVHDVPAIDVPFRRPWVDSDQCPPLKESILRRVEFPEEDESIGEIYICMFGPECSNHLEVRALSVVTEYLTGSSASVLQNIIVEKEQLASSIDIYNQTRPKMVTWIMLSSVETETLELVEQRFWEVLNEVVSGPLDMTYLHDCLRRLRKQIVYGAETRLGVFTDDLIYDHLYGRRDGHDLEDAVKSLDPYDQLTGWSEEQWKVFLDKYLAKNAHITVLGIPSRTVSENLKNEEAKRVEDRLKNLGPDGLKDLERKLEDAKTRNNTPIPDSVFECLPVPGSDSIPWMKTVTAKSGLARSSLPLHNSTQSIVDQDSPDNPLFIHFEQTPAKCIYFSLLLFADPIPTELKPLLNLYITNFFTSPIIRNGVRMEFEEVIKNLERNTIDFTIECGALNHTELIRIRFVVEPENYASVIEWLRDLLFNNIFDIERLKTAVGKLLADIPAYKRDGSEMAAAVDGMIHFLPKSAKRAQSTLVKGLYLRRINQLLEKTPNEVISRMDTLCRSLYTFQNMRVLVIGDIENLKNPVSSWNPFLQSIETKDRLLPILPQIDFYSEAARKPGEKSYIIPMGPIDSSYGYFTTQALQGFFHAKLPALILALAYLDTADGPLWTAVRGSGLAYGTNFSYSSQTGLLKLSIYRAPDAFKAYEAARKVVSEYVQEILAVDKFTFEGSISNIVLQYANEQTTMIQAGLLGFTNPVILDIPREYGADILREIRKVSTKDMIAAMKEFILPVFEPATANMVVTCATSLTENLKEGFKKCGFKAEVQGLDFFQDDYGLKGENGIDDELEGTDEDDGEDDGEEEDKSGED